MNYQVDRANAYFIVFWIFVLSFEQIDITQVYFILGFYVLSQMLKYEDSSIGTFF
jgi:hypothetical protein